jgi:hypothetical protein
MSENLKNGIAAHKAGDKVTARRLFAQALREDPNSERAWQWMFNVANNDTERIKCLREILRINPNNDKARNTLDDLQGVLRAYPARPSATTARPWYRSTAVYVILFFLFFPALLILILTDKEERQWTKVVSWIIIGLFFANLCVVGALTVFGPLINETFNDINREIGGGSVSDQQDPGSFQPQPNATEEFKVLPAGSALQDGDWVIKVDRYEIIDSIEFAGEINYPKNGRFLVLYTTVTNNGRQIVDYSPGYSAFVMDESGAYVSDFNLTIALWEPGDEWAPVVTLGPRNTGKVMAVYDISPSSSAYALGGADAESPVLLNLP